MKSNPKAKINKFSEMECAIFSYCVLNLRHQYQLLRTATQDN